MGHYNEHIRPSKEDIDEVSKILDPVDLSDQPYRVVDGLIRTSWEDSSPAQNCYTVISVSRILDISFDEALALFNRHVFFKRNSKEAKHHRARLLSMKQQAEDLLDHPDYISVHKRFMRHHIEEMKKTPLNYRTEWDRFNSETSPGNAGGHDYTGRYFGTNEIMGYFEQEMNWKIFADYEEIPFNNFTTKGFKGLEKTFHPLTAPNFKKELIDDYMVMQKELGIPFDEEGVHKLFGDSGVKHIWHMYGLLACQILTKTLEFWTIKNMYEWHDGHEEGNPNKSALDDTEFFVFLSCTRRLMQIKKDHNKIFTLLIFLYEEYANDKDWQTTWDFYYSLDGFADELKPSKFADRMMSSKSYIGSKGFSIRDRNYEWNTVYRAKEYSATDRSTTFDNYIEETYFVAPYSQDKLTHAPNLKFPK